MEKTLPTMTPGRWAIGSSASSLCSHDDQPKAKVLHRVRTASGLTDWREAFYDALKSHPHYVSLLPLRTQVIGIRRPPNSLDRVPGSRAYGVRARAWSHDRAHLLRGSVGE